jgi:hypothetical protein
MHLKDSYIVIASIAALAFARACYRNEDCSLNGLCDTRSATCTCDPGWLANGCGDLDVAPATRGTGYNYTSYTDSASCDTHGKSF